LYIGRSVKNANLKNYTMETITAELTLRPCTPEDLTQWIEGERNTLMRQRFYVRTDNKLECYTLANYSDKRAVYQFMQEGRLYIPCIEDLDGTYTGKVISENSDKAAA
jgi:hypothetical protein